MTLFGKQITMMQMFCLLLYKTIAQHFPVSFTPLVGGVSFKLRYMLCRHVFKKCGTNVNIEKGANFGCGLDIEIGDNSGLGINSSVPNGTIIGRDVMMGENCVILRHNHRHDRTDIPMNQQGFELVKHVVIEDDVWIGRDVTIMPGVHISKGCIIAASCVLTKDFPPYSIIGGVPGKVLKSRLKE